MESSLKPNYLGPIDRTDILLGNIPKPTRNLCLWISFFNPILMGLFLYNIEKGGVVPIYDFDLRVEIGKFVSRPKRIEKYLNKISMYRQI